MKQLYVVLISLFIGLEVGAQTTIATTHIVNNSQNGVTFNVKNNNAATVRLFAINSAHSLDQPTVASTVTVWYKISSSKAAPGAITAANGWTNAGSFALNRTYLATTPFISNLAIDIPADSTCRVFVGTTQTLGYETLTAGAGVNTFSSGGVDLLTGDSISFGGPSTGPTFTPRGFVGSVVVYPLGSCTGTPESGDVNVVGSLGACPNENRLYYLSGYIPSVNISYQWQVSTTSPTGTYTNIGTNSTLLARTHGATNEYFRCIATCSNSGLKDTTLVFADTVKPFYLCYCASAPNQIADTKIDSVIFATTRTGSPTTTCETYTDYRLALPTPKLRAGNSYPIEVVNGSCSGNFFSASGAVFLDFNKNGVFDAAERIGTGWATTALSQRYINNIVIPLNPVATGITGLRVLYYEGNITYTSACGVFPIGSTNSWGEVEDYLVEIIKDSVDAKLLSVINLENGCNMGNTNISFSVSNIGINAINPLTVSYSVNGGAPVTENFSTLAVGATSNYTFTTPADLSAHGSKLIKIWHNNPLDTNKTNDTVFKTIINFPTPPTPVADDDTVCLGAAQTILRAPSYDSFMTRWYTDAAATNEVAQGNQMVISNPTTNLTRYAKSVYVTSTNFGPPATVAPEVNVVGTGNGLIFDVLRNKVKINSVNMKFGTSGIGAIEIRNSANTLLSTSSFIVTYANSILTIPINFELPIGTGYRMILSTNPGISIASGSFTAFPQQVPSVISITGSTVANQYNMFYDWNITYDACSSPVVPVNSVYISTTNSPTRALFKDTFFCQYPDAYLNAQNSGATYKWQDGSTNQSIKVMGSNLYIVTITNSVGCNVVDSSRVTVKTSPIFSLGNDTTICSGKKVKLKSGFSNMGYNHVWSNGDLDPEILIDTPSLYSVSVFNTNTNCGYADTLLVSMVPSPKAFLGRDTFACNNTPITIRNLYTGTNYQYSWNGGAFTTNNTSTVTTSQKVYVEILDGSTAFGCKASDTVDVRIATLTKPNLGMDTFTCATSKSIGVAYDPNLGYKWNTGETTNMVNKTSTGTYILTVTEVNTTCSFSDTMKLTFKTTPALNLGPDIFKCVNSVVKLTANAGWDTYLWNIGFNTSSINVSTPGEYRVTATNACGTVSDTINVGYESPITDIILPSDTLVCDPLTLTIPSQATTNSVLWSTNETTQSIVVNTSGFYWVSVSNSCGAKSDAIKITMDTMPVPYFDVITNGTYVSFVNKSSANSIKYAWQFGDDSTSDRKNPAHVYGRTGTFQVKLIVENSCGDTVSYSKSVTLYNSSINSVDNGDIVVYPNPTSDKFIIENKSNQFVNELSIELISIDGRVIKSMVSKINSNKESEMNVQDVSEGTYWLRISDAENQQILKKVSITR